ncbi:putative membrane protein [Gottschalkia acidurici 9a]|uniref:Membrane protein n=1 Tax=Gottschalkia acidurici (strain ATCC 7906 / DSM 604 / BCRC 14475 / CIP 104303 / KCTC 5404 / NCIMB 10678 / 9a) TaxID=1128398 RepID=K0B447_GOTA9|nr:DUF6773 family protein [Gottschalkia acidurici]AFS79710.1 putative membrane protein [Gottschalkia acidurici 9a]
MGLFNKERGLVDERISNTMNKILKESYIITIIICFISIFIKSYLYGFRANLVITEIIVIIVSSLYSMIRKISLGVYSDEIEMHDRTSKTPMNIKNIIVGLALGIVISFYFGIRSSILYGGDKNRLWYFIIVFFASFIMYIPFLVGGIAITDFIARKASKKINEKILPEDKDLE